LEQHNNRLYLPKLGWLRYRNSRPVEGALCNVAVRRVGGKWFASIQTELEIATPVHPATTAVGIDLGIARFATLSDGTVYEPLHSFKRHEQALRKAQQALARKVKGSKNWRKAKARVQKMHARIAHVRQDYLHKLSHAISKNHAVVCLEDLQVRSMSASARGTAEAPGKNVRAKAGLNRAILDQGWGEFRRQLAYKLQWRGGRLIEVPPQQTSQTCPRCGHSAAENRQTQARFACVGCGFEANADLVAAINILSRGMQRLRDEGRDTADASAGMGIIPLGIIPQVYWRSQSREGIVPVSPDGLWIEPQGRSEAGTHRSDSGTP
ncbi:MAG TPA: transposase, partial [Candidatus Macondimonas sp.]|nr:transposase [Candidatus Macondimonas sp.]